MKAQRISAAPVKRSASLLDIPPYAICEYFNIVDLTMLRRTHPSCSTKYCQISTPIIDLVKPPINFDNRILTQYPKAKLIIRGSPLIDTYIENLTAFTNVISLNLSFSRRLTIDISLMTNLTSLDLTEVFIKEGVLDKMTQLVELNLNLNRHVFGYTLRKLTNLRTLSLEGNTIIKDEDIICLPLRSLSLVRNTTITPFVLGKLNLTHLNMESAMSSLTNELIHCTSLTDLHFTSQYRLRDPCRETIGKMTWLRKLISDDKQLLIFHLNQLTNLTYLERNALDGHIGAASLMSLQTLIVTGRCHPDIKFPLCPLENLTHLEIENYAHLNVCYLRNLTHLNVRVTHLPSNRELGEFKRLKKLIVSHNLDSSVRSRCSEGIDISVMSSLISLEILFCGVDMYFHMGRDGFVSLSLEQLRIETFGSNIDDSTLLRIPNLKYLRIGTDSCPRVTGVCFGSLAKLFEVSIGASDNLEEGCIDSLRRRGIIIKR